jgi:hypothetical protein
MTVFNLVSIPLDEFGKRYMRINNNFICNKCIQWLSVWYDKSQYICIANSNFMFSQ